MHCDNPSLQELVPVYILHACTEEETFLVKHHLQTCSDCQTLSKALKPAEELLLHDVPQMAAPMRLKSSIMNTVSAEASLFSAASEREQTRPAKQEKKTRRSIRDILTFPVHGWAVACTILITAFFSFFAANQVNETDPVMPIEQTMVASVTASKGSAVLHVTDKTARLTVSGMPSAGPGRIYQVWLRKKNEQPKPTDALFGVRSNGAGSVDVPGGIADNEQVLVTSEPAGGSSAPTRTPIISVDVA